MMTSLRLQTCLIFPFIMLTGTSFGAEVLPEQPALIAAVRSDSVPVLDGKLDDECWQQAVATSEFHNPDSTQEPAGKFTVAVLHTEKALYFGITFDLAKPAAGKGNEADQYISLLLKDKADEALPREFMIIPPKKVEGPWTAISCATPKGYAIEIEIPFSLFSNSVPAAGSAWKLAIDRKDATDPVARHAVWPDITSREDYENYGRLVFTGPFRGGARQALLSWDGREFYYLSPLSMKNHSPQGVQPPKIIAGKGVPAIVNPSFEDGLNGWQAIYSQRTYPGSSPVSLADKKATHGSQGAQIVSSNPCSPIQLITVAGLPPAGRYTLSCDLFFDNPALRDKVNLVVGRPMDVLSDKRGMDCCIVDYSAQTNGWYRQAIRFVVPDGTHKLVCGIEANGYVGTVRVDNIQIYRCPDDRLENDGLWYFDARYLDKHGGALRKRLYSMWFDKSPFVAPAVRFNDLLIQAAFLRDRSKQAQRLNVYQGKPPDTSLDQAVLSVDSHLAKSISVFIESYLQKDAASLSTKLEPLLSDLTKEIGRLDQNIPIKAPDKQPAREIRVGGEAVYNQLIFSGDSSDYARFAKGLDVWRTTHMMLKEPGKRADGTFDWSKLAVRTGIKYYNAEGRLLPYEEFWKLQQQQGLQAFGFGTLILGNSLPSLPPAFVKATENDPDVYIGGARQLNLWHPAVLELNKNLATGIGAAFKSRPEILFYHYAWESGGPGRLSPADTDPNKSSGLRSFRKFLREKYKTIAALNSAWKTGYADFDTITAQGADSKTYPNPLGYEYELWRQDSYIDHARAIYEAWKKADPHTPVMPDHSRLFYEIDPTRIFETCDLLSVHGRYELVSCLWAASNKGLYRKRLAKFENWWASDGNCWGDERIQYANLAKYLYRSALQGCVLQQWWFPYTSQTEWEWRQAQWANPRDDYLTLRYSAAALPVSKDRAQRLEQALLNTQWAPADILVVFPRTTWLRQPAQVRNGMTPVVEYLFNRGYRFEFRSETRIANGEERLEDYKLILLPAAPELDDTVADKMLVWIKKGGSLIAFGPAGIYDKYGFDDGKLMRETIGVAPKPEMLPNQKVMRWNFGVADDTLWIRKNVGQGKIFVATRPLNELLEYPQAIQDLKAIVDNAAPPLASSSGDCFEFYLLKSGEGKEFLAVLNPSSVTDITSRVFIRGQFSKLVDLDIPGGFAVPCEQRDNRTFFNLMLPPGGMTVFALER